jgi:hypothetical protein
VKSPCLLQLAISRFPKYSVILEKRVQLWRFCPVVMRFEVKLGNEIIGFSELEGGDPPMGVASGRFVPTPAYTSIQPYSHSTRGPR